MTNNLMLPEMAKTSTSFKKVTGVKPFGSSILIKRLTAAEIMGTNLYVGNAQASIPQFRVVDFGPSIKPEDAGLKIGDRLICVGSSTLVPSLDNENEYSIIEIHNVKAVLSEE